MTLHLICLSLVCTCNEKSIIERVEIKTSAHKCPVCPFVWLQSKCSFSGGSREILIFRGDPGVRGDLHMKDLGGNSLYRGDSIF